MSALAPTGVSQTESVLNMQHRCVAATPTAFINYYVLAFSGCVWMFDLWSVCSLKPRSTKNKLLDNQPTGNRIYKYLICPAEPDCPEFSALTELKVSLIINASDDSQMTQPLDTLIMYAAQFPY